MCPVLDRALLSYLSWNSLGLKLQKKYLEFDALMQFTYFYPENKVNCSCFLIKHFYLKIFQLNKYYKNRTPPADDGGCSIKHYIVESLDFTTSNIWSTVAMSESGDQREFVVRYIYCIHFTVQGGGRYSYYF